MSYFVTGATGFIGRHLVERLLEREGDIHVLVREGSREKLDALILSAPAASLEAASAPVRLIGRVLSAIAPTLGVFDVDPSTISRDPAEVAAYANDPLNHQGRLPARTVAELTSAIEKFPERVEGIELPLLVMHGSADEEVPLMDARALADAAEAAAELRVVPQAGHGLRHDPRAVASLLGWLERRAG